MKTTNFLNSFLVTLRNVQVFRKLMCACLQEFLKIENNSLQLPTKTISYMQNSSFTWILRQSIQLYYSKMTSFTCMKLLCSVSLDNKNKKIKKTKGTNVSIIALKCDYMERRKTPCYMFQKVVEAACCWSIIAVWHLIEKYIGTSWIAAVAKQNKSKNTKPNQLYTKQNHRVEMTRYNKAGSQRIERRKEKDFYTLIWEYVKTEMKMPNNVPRSLQLSWVLDVDSKTQYISYVEKS